jgi:hypothetical protein
MTEFCRDVLIKISKENADNDVVEEENAPKSFIKQLFKISQSGETFNDGAVLAETITAVLAVRFNIIFFFSKFYFISLKKSGK